MKKVSSYHKLMFFLIIVLFVSGCKTIPVVEKSENTSVVKETPVVKEVSYTKYSEPFLIKHKEDFGSVLRDFYNVTIILPDGQVAYLPEFPFNKSVLIAYSTEDGTHYNIVDKYKKEIKDVCVLFDYMERKTGEFYIKSVDCFEDLNQVGGTIVV
ncbi:hypothetical protein HQ529_04435 [Candidatus Woesearchaeota archaeon]|nr:hypothetical protein [Candidatus Woesearchaeota archaeon]